MGNYQGRDLNVQARLKLSIEIEIFNPGLKPSSVWIENFTRSIGIAFLFNRRALWVWDSPKRYQSLVTPLLRGRKAPKCLFYCVSVQSERGGGSVTDLC